MPARRMVRDKYRIDVVTGAQKQVACGVGGFVSRTKKQVAGVGFVAKCIAFRNKASPMQGIELYGMGYRYYIRSRGF